MKDIHLTVTLRNNLLKRRREELGLTTHGIAEAVGIGYQSYIGLEALRRSPLRTAPVCRFPSCEGGATAVSHFLCPVHRRDYGMDPDRWPEQWPTKKHYGSTVRKLACFLGVQPEELFPESIQRIAKPVVTAEVDAADLEALATSLALPLPDDAIAAKELADSLEAALATLTPREERVLRERFGLAAVADPNGSDAKTFRTMADERECSVERLRQIQEKALRKLRHPSRCRVLKEFIES